MVGVDFDQQLNGLEREIGMLAEIVERAVQRAIEALKSRDAEWWRAKPGPSSNAESLDDEWLGRSDPII